ncbi:MAG: serine/threonine protein kinase [Methylococcaceae bacterium]|nr:serine/threonine protein kinase [Methylococcaceae bacterium]
MTEYYDPDTYPQEWNYLEPGTIIDQYIIERRLAHGGFSSVYLARQLSDQVQVAIKEYLPRKLAHRTWNNTVIPHDETASVLFMRGRELFFKEAKVLVNLKHANIVEAINFFEANATVYMVMSYDYGICLDKLIKNAAIEINEAFLLTVFRQLLLGVAAIHAHHLIHLDIKPANILIRPDNNPLLLDFGAIQHFPMSSKRQQARICSQGFSPLEQYENKGNMGPWSDVYAVGASMRTCLDGKIPPAAPERAKQDTLKSAAKVYKQRYSQVLLQVIDAAMQVQPQDRPQSIAVLQRLLNY